MFCYADDEADPIASILRCWLARPVDCLPSTQSATRLKLLKLPLHLQPLQLRLNFLLSICQDVVPELQPWDAPADCFATILSHTHEVICRMQHTLLASGNP